MKARIIRRRQKTLPRTFGGPGRIITTALAVFVASQFVAALLAEIFLNLTHSGTNLNNSVPANFLSILLAEGLAAGLVLKIIKTRGLGLSAIGLGRRPRWTDLGRALLAFVVFYGLLIVVTLLLGLIFPRLNLNQPQDVGFNNLSGPLGNLLAFVALVLLPPLGEEPLVRGYLYSGLLSRWRFVPAMILTSLLFGVAHLEFGSGSSLVWAAGADTFVLSLVLVYLRERTGALYAGMLVHVLNNLIAFAVHFH